MSKNRKRYREFIQQEEEKCEKKKTFYDRVSAKEASKKYKLKFKTPYKVYKCPYCGMYHLTTLKKEEKKND